MQNGIFLTGDKFVIKILVFSTLQNELIFFIKLNTTNSDLYVFVPLNVLFFQCQTGQTGGKPLNSPLVTVKSSFHGH